MTITILMRAGRCSLRIIQASFALLMKKRPITTCNDHKYTHACWVLLSLCQSVTSFETGTHKDGLLGLLVTEIDDGSEETGNGVNDSFHHQYIAAYNLHSVHIHLPQVTSILLCSGYLTEHQLPSSVCYCVQYSLRSHTPATGDKHVTGTTTSIVSTRFYWVADTGATTTSIISMLLQSSLRSQTSLLGKRYWGNNDFRHQYAATVFTLFTYTWDR